VAATEEAGELRKHLGTRELTIYYLSALVGAGILVVPGIALEIAGPASLAAWLVLSIATFPIAAVFARFSAEYPNASGVAYVVRTAFGWRAGTSTGLLLLLINLVGNPILGLAAARYLVALFGWTDRLAVLTAAFVVMSVAVLLNMAGILIASKVQAALVFGLAVGLLVVIAVSLPSADPDRLVPFAPHGWTAIGAAIVVSFFSFFGWEAIAHVADEVRDPRSSYPKAAMIAAALLGVLYCSLALVLALVVPADAANKAAALSALLQFSHGDAPPRSAPSSPSCSSSSRPTRGCAGPRGCSTPWPRTASCRTGSAASPAATAPPSSRSPSPGWSTSSTSSCST
jgi:amino acid efflux transporter